ncbi:ABC transporter permease [Antribacter gilvus]|uniref:ABC transporter permease n=1 Tax=Antribacter gilvus TaxID=2304675 RepID=UPI000F79BD49|nr:ABC-2 family transporter protein [Antribacter gilvus]
MNQRTVRVTVLVWLKLFRQAVMRDLQFRSQAWLHLFAGIGELAVGILPVLILTSYAGSDSALQQAAVLTVGVFALTTGLMDCFVTPGLRRFDTAVRKGELDLALVRPVPTFFYAVLRWIQPTELARCVSGTAILIVAASTFDLGLGPEAVLAMIVWAVAGTVAYCAFWTDLTLLAFWVRSIEPVNDLAAAWRVAGQYPRQFFPRTVQIILVSFAPAALIGSFPAEQLLDPTAALLLAPVVVLVSCSFTALIWRYGLARYNSASS